MAHTCSYCIQQGRFTVSAVVTDYSSGDSSERDTLFVCKDHIDAAWSALHKKYAGIARIYIDKAIRQSISYGNV